MFGKHKNAHFEAINNDDVAELFEKRAHHYLNISGEEFLKHWDAGRFADDDSFEVSKVAMLVPFVR